MNKTLTERQLDACLLVLGRGLVEIRLAAMAGDAARCEKLADALHNLPDLLREGDRRGWTIAEFCTLFLDESDRDGATFGQWIRAAEP